MQFDITINVNLCACINAIPNNQRRDEINGSIFEIFCHLFIISDEHYLIKIIESFFKNDLFCFHSFALWKLQMYGRLCGRYHHWLLGSFRSSNMHQNLSSFFVVRRAPSYRSVGKLGKFTSYLSWNCDIVQLLRLIFYSMWAISNVGPWTQLRVQSRFE